MITRIEAVVFVLDEIELLNDGKGPFHGKIDTATAMKLPDYPWVTMRSKSID